MFSLIRHRLGDYRRNQRGTVMILFALMITILVSLVGGAVDFGQWLKARNATLNAMDAAVLAAGRVMQLPGKTEADALAMARKYYEENKPGMLDPDTVAFDTAQQGTEIIAVSTGSATKTSFLGVIGITSLPVNASSKALLAASSNAGSDVEIALMLDTTGSMGGSKMTDLKIAAKDLIDIVVWADQSTYSSRVALAPFSRYVNVGATHFTAVTGATAGGTGNQRTCVKERSGTDRYTDESPSVGGYFNYYGGTGTCDPTSTIMPLTNNKSALKAHIDGFPTTGTTAGHLGTAWAWYLISPKWSGVFPVGSEPKPYSMTTELNESGQPKLHKIAVLMTDGIYNKKYSGDDSTIQARAICDNMKAAGVTIYTVGFEITVGSTPDLTMQYCAKDSSYYYNASTGEALKQAFRDIALKISTLRLAE